MKKILLTAVLILFLSLSPFAQDTLRTRSYGGNSVGQKGDGRGYLEQSGDRDGDGISDEEEDEIALDWLPNIYADASDDCLPLIKYDGGWCEKYDHNSQYKQGAYHQKGYIGYDVVDVGFADLLAIEYTLFLDYQCKDVAWFYKNHHFFENEGFTILLRRSPSGHELLSIKTIGHHKTEGETSDKLYPHEVQGWKDGGMELLSAENTHAIYVHHDVCARMFVGFENCGEEGSRILINPICEKGPYDTTPCPYPENLPSLTAHTDIPACWSKRLHLLGTCRYEEGIWCHPWEDGETRLHVRRKRLPPWIPIEVSLPENLAYVDLFLAKNFTAPSDRRGEYERENFGDALVDAHMPMRLINFPDYDWWREYYDPDYQRNDRHKNVFGLANEALRYVYWKPRNDLFKDKVDYWNDVESLILHGLPGTVLTLYDYHNEVFEYYGTVIMPDGRRTVGVSELDSLWEGMNNDVEFITWGFGPTADAGNDTTVQWSKGVILDATGSYKYAPNLETLRRTFNVPDTFDYKTCWGYVWIDESYPGVQNEVLLGFGDRLFIPCLPPGQHRIRLCVSGQRYPYPHRPDIHWVDEAYDWRTVIVNPIDHFTIFRPGGVARVVGGCRSVILWGPACSSRFDRNFVKIELSTDGGISWSEIADSAENTGSYSWSVPNISSTQCLIRVTYLDQGLVDVTDGVFTIVLKEPPMVLPANNSIGAPDSTSISITFGLDMDEATINDSSLFVYTNINGLKQVNITYDSQATVATLVPQQKFVPGAIVSLIMEKTLRYADHLPFCGPFNTSFTVGVEGKTDVLIADSTYVVGDLPSCAIPGDFDKDGDTDIAITNQADNQADNSVLVLLNDGKGRFESGLHYPVGERPHSVVAADIDKDGDLDLVTSHINSRHLSILRNDGNGNFSVEQPELYPGQADVISMVVGEFGDFLGNGCIDFAATIANENRVAIVINKELGIPGLVYLYSLLVGEFPTGITSGDFDNDGDNDLATANHLSNDVSVLINQGWGDFVTESSYEVAPAPYSIVAADFDADGDLDIATGHGSAVSTNTVSVLYNNGDATFGPAVSYTVGFGPLSVAAADLNGDNFIDLVYGNADDDNISVLLNNGDGTFASHFTYQVGDFPFFVTVADFDGDGDLDLVTVNRDSDNISVLFNEQPAHILSTTPQQNELNASLSTNISAVFSSTMDVSTINDTTFIVHARSSGPHEGTITCDTLTKTATFDPSSDFDVGEVVTVVLTNDVQSSRGIPLDKGYIWSFTVDVDDGPGTFAPDSAYPVGDYPNSVYAADLDGDGDLDLTTANSGSNNVSVLLNNGDGTFAHDLAYPVGDYPNCIFAADLDGDGDLDLVTSNLDSDNVSILLNKGDGTFAPDSAHPPVGGNPHSIFVADLDGDGDLDVSTANYSSHNLSILFNNGDSTFAPDSVYLVGDCPNSVYAADLDGDGDLDLTTANYCSDNVSVLLNNGDGTFASDSVYSVGNCPRSVFAADLNGDGDLDLVTANYWSNDVSVLLNNGDGIFAADSAYPVGYHPNSVFIADLDGDGDLDLTITDDIDGDVSVLRNNGDGTFTSRSDYPVGRYPVSVFAADLDGDGDLDLATANRDSHSVSVLLNQESDPQPPTFTVGILQNPIFSAELNVYVIASESLKTAPIITIGTDTLAVEQIYYEGATIYSSNYKLTTSGTFQIKVVGTDLADNEGLHTETFAAGSIWPSGGNVVSHDNVLRLDVGSGAVDKQEYFLVFIAGNQGGKKEGSESYIRSHDLTHPNVSWDKTSEDIISAAYSITPSQLKLRTKAKLSISYAGIDLEGKDPTGLGIHRLDADIWKAIPSYLDSDKRQIVAFIDKLGVYQLRYGDPTNPGIVPTTYVLENNYPNPFNNSTNISFETSSPGWVKIDIYNVLGQKVKTLVDEYKPIGRYTTEWNGTNEQDEIVSAGIYFYTLKINEFTETKKMVFLK